MRRTTHGERGSVAAEFAVALPAVGLVLALGLGAVELGALDVRLQDAASLAARALARGDDPPGAALPSGAALTRADADGLVCATVVASGGGAFAAVRLSARSCAWDERAAST